MCHPNCIIFIKFEIQGVNQMIDYEKVFKRIDALEKQYITLLEEFCLIESPTDSKEGVDAAGNYIIEKPCMPKEWAGVKITHEFRGCKYHITIKNPDSKMFIPHVEGRKEYTAEV